jgi:hypothetical protein
MTCSYARLIVLHEYAKGTIFRIFKLYPVEIKAMKHLMSAAGCRSL